MVSWRKDWTVQTIKTMKTIKAVEQYNSLSDAATLSKMSFSEIEQLYNQTPKPTPEQKQRAWKMMDTGIYDIQGNLIGDKCLDEDDYQDN